MKALIIFPLLAVAAMSRAGMTTIDFEGLANNVVLSNQYASLGATFGGTDSHTSIRTPGAAQTYPARSGLNVVSTWTSGLTNISFSHDVSDVSVWVLSSFTFGAKLTARDVWGATVATATNSTNAAYRELKVHGGGIRGITIQAPAGYAVIDDLSFTAAPVPEPASLAALGFGLAFLRRRRNRESKG